MVHTVCMVSDFFYPNVGGIEEHIYNLSQCLIERGHKIVVVTHTYGDRKGVRWMTNGLKVYYVPAQVFYNGAILPNMVTLIPIFREILIREEIQIVHGHGAFSSLAHDGLFVGKLLGLKTVFTDHSLFGFADASAIITNRFLEISLADVNHSICVSHTGKANTVLRAKIKGKDVSVIPNAVDMSMFTPIKPGEIGPPADRVVIIILSRLVYRKGVDLMSGIIPIIIEKYDDVDFLIGGDGPKRLQLEELKERYVHRVRLVGKIDHALVRDFFIQGHIFLNTSLTEAYCMAIVEAAASGLKVVSTRVGGIPEVLPPGLITLSSPNVGALVEELDIVIDQVRRGDLADPWEAHAIISSLYNWRDVARRTEAVYDGIVSAVTLTDSQRMRRYLKFGRFVGPLFCLVLGLTRIIMWICERAVPRHLIDIVKSYPAKATYKARTL
ncbi:unnamed protein product [Orchesella dallaii]|uniref:PIGA GPI anchor biosynthesis domain-containing protein n=1 Tax=Orchesella dallaii TaxID=48710 RepID=A0ABP1R3I2_9HEXA